MFERIKNNPFVQDFRKTLFSKPAIACFYLSATALIVAALAIGIFFVGPYMPAIALGALSVAKWTAIVGAGAAVICLGQMVGQVAWEIIKRKRGSA